MYSALTLTLVPVLTFSALMAPIPAHADDGVPISDAGWSLQYTPTSPFNRVSGDDRFATSVAAAESYPTGVPVVYVASGADFPDALSAAPAATIQGGPLLLTHPTSLPALVRDEIARLAPGLIVVAGGEGAVSASVYDELASLGTEIRRDAGVDRYETSRVVNQNAFPAGNTSVAFFATGADFPDALSASAAAGSRSGPVILVDGGGQGLDAATVDLVTSLGISEGNIAGGAGVIPGAIEDSLNVLLGADAVDRFAGSNRFSTSSAVNRGTFSSATTAYFAVGTGFADALTGAALAGREGAPLYVVPGNCVPAQVVADLEALGTTKRVLLGGAAVLGAGVESLTVCAAPAGFSQPFDRYVPIVSSFGLRVHPITGDRRMHYGTDYSERGIAGTPIRSIAEGTIVYRSVSYATTGAGNAVSISHPDGMLSVSMHMKDPSPLAVGARVAAGTVVGYVGSTGGSTGPHLHLEVRSGGVPVDPAAFLRYSPLAPSS